MKKTRKNSKYLLVYTIAFFVTMALVFLPIIESGKVLVSYNDSYLQHYPFILKIKKFYENLLFNHQFNLMAFNEYSGLDFFDLYTYYGLGNPFSLLFIGWKTEYLPYVFSFVVILKLYLGGLAVQYLGKELECDRRATLLCSLLYVINPFAISALEQFNFYDVIYQLPLLVAGIHQVFKKKKSILFMCTLTLTFMCGYYWLYVQTLLLTAYALFYVFSGQGKLKEKIKFGFSALIHTAKHYMLALLLSAWIFVPSIVNISKMYRVSGQNKYNLFFYPLDTIKNMIGYSLFYNSKYWVTVWLVLIPVIIYMLKYIKRYKSNIIIIFALYAVSIIPMSGYIGNGFVYPINRWFSGAYLFILLICILPLKNMMDNIKIPKMLFVSTLLVLSFIQPLVFTYYYSDFCMTPEWLNSETDDYLRTMIDSDDRIDYNGHELDYGLIFNNNNQLNVYNSSLPKNILETYRKLGLSSMQDVSIVAGLDYRSELEALYNVNKYLAKYDAPVPYGFKEIYRNKNDETVLYENKNELHFGYTYDSYINESKAEMAENPGYSWNALSSCLVEEEFIKDINVSEKKADNSLVSQTKFNVNNISSEEKQISFNKLTNCEVYAKVKMDNVKLSYFCINSSNGKNERKIVAPESVWLIDRDYYYFNVGAFEEISGFSISCEENFEIEAVLYHSLDDFENEVKELDKYHLENVSFESNTINGDIDVPDNRILCLSVPYQDGWSAEVDGQKTDIMQVNGYLMGINITPGKHHIRLYYMNRWLVYGSVISTLTFVGLFSCILYRRKRVLC